MITSSLKLVAATAGLALSLLSASDTSSPRHDAVDGDEQSFTDNPEYRGDLSKMLKISILASNLPV